MSEMSMADWKKAIEQEKARRKADQEQPKKKPSETATNKKISRDDL